MAKKDVSFNNLIDECMRLNEDPDRAGRAQEQFIAILTGYFFGNEAGLNRGFELFLANFDPPEFLSQTASLFDTDIDKLTAYVNGTSLNDSLSGRIMLSPQYLKAFYPHHPPSFNKLPEDVRFELMDLIKEKNAAVIAAFTKMMMDRQADRKRKVLTLVALIIKNVHLRTGSPLNRLPRPAEDIIRSIFNSADEVFAANQRQMADLRDDTKIKQLVKTFFTVKQFKEITGVADMFRDELERYQRRTLSAAG